MEMENIARWAYVIFVFVAILAGLALGYSAYSSYSTRPTDPPVHWAENIRSSDGVVLIVMIILGVITGLTSITTKEVTPFLISTIALLAASASNVWAGLWYIHPLPFFWASAILSYIVAFAAPAAVIIAIRSVLRITGEHADAF